MTKPLKFKRGKTTVEAMRFGGLSNGIEVRRWVEKHGAHVKYTVDYGMFQLISENAVVDVLIGDWLVKDKDGFYPVQQKTFVKNYKEVTAP